MSFQVSAVSSSSHIDAPPAQVIRRSANYNPSLWGNYFLPYSNSMDKREGSNNADQEVEKLKEEVERMLTNAAAFDHPLLQKLQLMDAIQRLGLSYHFENQIHEMLRNMQEISLKTFGGAQNIDLYTVSLWFRLLRQEGFNVSSDIFNKFIDNEGKFKKELKNDIEGMLSLYEASHLRVHGEQILEEALCFTTTHLADATAAILNSNPLLAEQVKHALRRPIRKGLPRLEARHYISIYQQHASHDEALLRFAKMDFNILQKLHQKELSDISRVVECYFWALGVYFEPDYALGRRMLTKVIAITSVIDDIYDVHGTFHELQLFTYAIQRWDVTCMDQLPDYMKYCYEALLDIYKEIEQVMTKEGRLYSIHYAKEKMKKQSRVYFAEAKWLNKKYIPTLDESCGYPMLTATSFLGMGDIATKEAFEWVTNGSKIVKSSSIICRIMDDLVGHKSEQEREHVASSVECYMKQHGVSEKEACDELQKEVVEAWKDINEECLEPRGVPMSLLIRVVNCARVIDVLYKDGDGYTHAGDSTKKIVSSLLVDPLPM